MAYVVIFAHGYAPPSSVSSSCTGARFVTRSTDHSRLRHRAKVPERLSGWLRHEEDMTLAISQELEAKILRYFHVEKWLVGTIAQQLGVHHTTVDRVLSQAGLPKAERAHRPSLIDPYLPFVLETLKQYPRLTASRLHAMVGERGYTGGEDHFRHLISLYRPRPQPEAYLRLKTLPGEQAQVDWGLCRARHRPHYADTRTMPSRCTEACLFSRRARQLRPCLGAANSALPSPA